MKIESFTKIIHHERPEGQLFGTFHLESNPQYVDINNLNKYKKNELITISRGYGKWFSGAGWTKSKLISAILNDVDVVNKIKSTNREISLKTIGI
jgi:hypothetical protein